MRPSQVIATCVGRIALFDVRRHLVDVERMGA
jgi:hypothetical protein